MINSEIMTNDHGRQKEEETKKRKRKGTSCRPTNFFYMNALIKAVVSSFISLHFMNFEKFPHMGS